MIEEEAGVQNWVRWTSQEDMKEARMRIEALISGGYRMKDKKSQDETFLVRKSLRWEFDAKLTVREGDVRGSGGGCGGGRCWEPPLLLLLLA